MEEWVVNQSCLQLQLPIVLLNGLFVCLIIPNNGEAVQITTEPLKSNHGFGYSCTFSDGLCEWTQDYRDDFDWTRGSGSTSTAYTGPDSDHTTTYCSTCTDHYLYIETSSPRRHSDRARLLGPAVNIPENEYMCFSFWYNMHGTSIGQLNIYIKQHGLTSNVWTTEHDHGKRWFHGEVTVKAGENSQIIIEAICGTGIQSDIAIDDTDLRPGLCGKNQATSTYRPYQTTYPWRLTTGYYTTAYPRKTPYRTSGYPIKTESTYREHLSTYPWWLKTKDYTTAYPWQHGTSRYPIKTVSTHRQDLSTYRRYQSTYPWWLTTAYYTTYQRTTARHYKTESTYRPYHTTYPWWITTGYFTTSYPWQHSQTTSDYGLYASITVDCTKYTWDIIVDLDRLRKVYPNAKGSDIYLGENRCSGVEKHNLLIFNNELTECLTSEMLLNGVHVYNNELIYAEHDPVYLYIIRHYNWTIGVECHVQRDGTADSSLQKPDQSTLPPSINSPQYPVNVSFFSNANYVQQIPGNPLHVTVGSPVYVKVFTTTLDWNTKMRVHTCYAAPTEHALDHLKYYLIKNGCEVDGNTHIISQSTHETKFVFNEFEYANSQGGIYVHCDVTFCASNDWSINCRQTCTPVVRKKR